MHYAATKRNHDGHLTFYVLLSGLLEYQKFLFYFSRHPALCIYLYPPTPTNTQMDTRPFGTLDIGTIRQKRNSSRIHLMNDQ